MRRIGVNLITCGLLFGGGCGVASVMTDFPNRLVGAQGQEFVLEDLEAIATHPNMSDDRKRDRFRELGIEDEKLIDALLGL
ncbi:MAG: hypothetical protein IIB60_02300 [Planctomycetes bacterium]|nr:hypothetical protein [Planctomycetota bacterium]